METVILVAQTIIGVLLIGAILLQAQGSGLGTTWGGGGETYHTKRGLEKVIFYATIGLVVMLVAVSVLGFLV